MPYTKTNWIDKATPLSAKNMNNLESQYDEAKADLDAKMNDVTGHKHTGAAGDGPPIPASSIIDGDGSGLKADLWGGLKWLKPGADITLWQALDEEYSYNTKTLTKRFVAKRPGMYRLSGEARVTNTSNSLTIQIVKEIATGVIGVPDLGLTTQFATSSSSYVSFSIDMTIPVLAGDCIAVVFQKNSTDVYAYWKNLKITASEGVPTFDTDGLHVVNLT